MRMLNKASAFKKVLVTILTIIFLIIQISLISFLVTLVSNKHKKVIMTYVENTDINYNVVLKNNDLVPDEYNNNDNAYIVNLIDHITLVPTYEYKSSKKTKLSGKSALVASLKVYYKNSFDASNNPEVSQKKKVLIEEEIKATGKKYNNTLSYDIKLGDYLKTLDKFKDDMKINVDGFLDISYETDIKGKLYNSTYINKDIITLRIPLGDSVSQFEKEASAPRTTKVYGDELIKISSKVKIFLIVSNLIVFLILAFLLKCLFKLTDKPEYDKKLAKILRNYDDIIVNTKSMIDKKKYKVVVIDDFKEMLNLSRELLFPIMCYESPKKKETKFYIVKDGLLYIYTLSEKK